jgi:putrescine transport system ATP-binding protein
VTAAAEAPFVRLEGVVKRFGATVAVDDVSLTVERGAFFALLGPSGCGKTTLLRMLAGFERPDRGRILIDGADVAEVPPYERPTNMMFQSYALFPHMTAAENVGFGLRQERLPRAAIAEEPKLLLLDEPLAALDRKLREETRLELVRIQHRVGVTFLMVTHDQEEAMTMASRMAVMSKGRLVQVGTPAQIYEHPSCRFVADFIGAVNLFEGRIASAGAVLAVDCPDLGRAISVAGAAPPGAAVAVAVRPERIALSTQPLDLANRVRGTVREIAYRGEASTYHVAVGGGRLVRVTLPNAGSGGAPPPAAGATVWLGWDAQAGVLLTS